MGILDLWMPILASAVAVWIASATIWMALPWHKTDYGKTTDEDAVRAALKGQSPGLYSVPHCIDQKALQEPGMKEKFDEGPIAYISVLPDGMPSMGKNVGLSFVLNILVGVICAYMVSRTVAPGADYLSVFRVAGTVAFVAYGIAYFQETIWFGRPLSVTLKNLLDALIYGLLTGGVFGWLA